MQLLVLAVEVVVDHIGQQTDTGVMVLAVEHLG